MKRIVCLHLIPFSLFTIVFYWFLWSNFEIATKPKKTLIISGASNKERYLSSIGSDTKNQLALIESLIDKNTLTIFGSSELTNQTSFIPYNFLPDSLNMSCHAFGHAHFQSLAMYCQLLGMREYIRNSKIAIIVSPGWFEFEGTNIEAFIENVRPEFLKRIIWDSSISISDKKVIGKYLLRRADQIDFPSAEIEYLQLLASNTTIIDEYKRNHIKKNFLNNYQYKLIPNSQEKDNIVTKEINWERLLKRLKSDFLKSSKTNPYFISDSYFNRYIKKLDEFRKKEYKPINEGANTELKDLLVLIRFLKKESVKPVFIVQGLNPHYYSNLHKFNPILKEIKVECKKMGFPVLDLFSDKTANYEPGILNDVMHMGDYGWLKVNQFLMQSFYE